MRSLVLTMLFAFTSFVHAQEPDEREQVEGEVPVPGNSQNGDLNSNTVSSNNNNDNRTYNGNAPKSMPVQTAIAPSLISSGMQSCLRSKSRGLQIFTLGYSNGHYEVDPFCERRALAVVLHTLGLKVASVSLLCQDPSVYKALLASGSPCPTVVRGKMVVGRNNYLLLKQEGREIYIPDYNDSKEYYDTLLGVGEDDVIDEEDTNESLSARFRTSIR